MFRLSKKTAMSDRAGVITDVGRLESRMAAFDRLQAIIEFSADGIILGANENFLKIMGYRWEEIRGQHHKMFVSEGYRTSAEYRAFWEKLEHGELDAGEYLMLGKNGSDVWLLATYNPILDEKGKPVRVVKLATDITAAKASKISDACQRAALESVRTNVMVADENYNITYMNNTMIEMMRSAEVDLRKDVPSLDVKKLIGTNIDAFHKNPPHQRRILESLTKTIETNLVIGGRSFHLIVTPIFANNRQRLGTVVEWKDETELKKLEAAAIRVRTALDTCQTNVMVADEAYNIVYMNNTMQTMIRGAEAEMRRDVPALDSQKLIGSNIDIFHKNPSHQRRILDGLTNKVETDLNIGGRNFHLIVSPITSQDGKRIGTTVEWKDETAEKAIEVEIGGVVKGAIDGDLTRKLSLDGKKGFMFNLATSINKLCENFGRFIGEVTAAARDVSNASAEISMSTTDLSQRTEEQAASLEQTSASMEQMAATVKKNADNAQEANQSSTSTRQIADRGGEVVSKAVEAMAKIEESSRKITDIIGVIDEIARQTNLLALNAAVEAARAGEAGRGFAVVASEVRSLAQRSSQAAKDIKDLITNSGAQVREGVELVNRAGAALSEIVESIKKVVGIVSDIAAASIEQSAGIEQINKALAQMDEVTQQNSAVVEENAATAKTLEHSAKALDDQVSAFRIDVALQRATQSTEHVKPAGAPTSMETAAQRRKSTEVPKRASVAGNHGHGPVGQMQKSLATAVGSAQDWKEF